MPPVVITFRCQVCGYTFGYRPKKLDMVRVVCPTCFAASKKVGTMNPFSQVKKPFSYDAAELLMLGGVVEDIVTKLHTKYSDKERARIRSHVVDISRRMLENGFYREYKRGGWLKVVKILDHEELTFDEDVMCTKCGCTSPMHFEVTRLKRHDDADVQAAMKADGVAVEKNHDPDEE